MAATVSGVLLTGDHASRPSSGVSVGTLYSCTTHSLVYQTTDTGSTWVTWANLAGTGALATDTLWDAKGDRVFGTGANTAAKHTAPANGKLSVADSAQSDGWRDTFGLYFSRRLMGSDLANANTTLGVNSTSYGAFGNLEFVHDWDAFPATHFHFSVLAFANEATRTITGQLAAVSAPATPYSASGDDIVVPNNAGAVGQVNSGWIAVSGTPTGITLMCLALKGSTATVDLTGRWVDVAFKIV